MEARIEVTIRAHIYLKDADTILKDVNSVSVLPLGVVINGQTVGVADSPQVQITDINRELDTPWQIVAFTNNQYCVANNCRWKKECAQHISAGDYRSEDGFSPRLRKTGDDIECQSYNTKINVEEEDYSRWPRDHYANGSVQLAADGIHFEPTPDPDDMD